MVKKYINYHNKYGTCILKKTLGLLVDYVHPGSCQLTWWAPMPTTLRARGREQERWQKSEGKEKKNIEQTRWIQNKLRRKGKKWKRREGTLNQAARVAVRREQLRSDYQAVGVLSEIGQKVLTRNVDGCGSLPSWSTRVHVCVPKLCISKCQIQVMLKSFPHISNALE